MRILLSFENFGGTETYTATVANELGRLGHHVMVYSPNRGRELPSALYGNAWPASRASAGTN